VVSTTFTIELGPVSGEMHICMPYSDWAYQGYSDK
jgi:flagellar motor switch protein FliM